MTNVSISRCSIAAALAAGLAIASPAFAETMSLKAELKAGSEVPPNDSKGTGTVSITYDTATKGLTWKGTVSGLSGPATAAHFHGPAEPGKNARVIVPISNPGSGTLEGSATLTDEQANALLAGNVYVNVHTAAHPGGELRGQVVK